MPSDSSPNSELEPGSFLTMAAGAPFDFRLGNAAVRVLAALSSFRSAKKNTAFPSTALLAAGLGLKDRAVQKQLSKLERCGYIQEIVDPRARNRGSRTWRFIMIPKPSPESMRSGASRSPTANPWCATQRPPRSP